MTQLHTVASLDYGDGRTCICRICECGKHHCPGVKVPFVGETTYRDEYVPKKAEHERLRRNRGGVFPTKAEPGHFKTTKQEAAELLEGQRVRPAESYKPRPTLEPPLPFDATTTNRADFPGYMPEYHRAQRRQDAIPKLKGTYHTTKGAMDEPISNLAAKGALPRPPHSLRGTDAEQESLPFDGVTSYTADYPAKSVPYNRLALRAATESVPENRDFQTTSTSTYQIPPPHMHHNCPASFVPARPASTDGHIKLSVYNIPSGDTINEDELTL